MGLGQTLTLLGWLLCQHHDKQSLVSDPQQLLVSDAKVPLVSDAKQRLLLANDQPPWVCLAAFQHLTGCLSTSDRLPFNI